MEYIIGFVVVGLIVWVGLRLNRSVRSAAGYGKRPTLLREDEHPSHELEVEAPKFKGFSGFSLHSANEGKLFVTHKRLLFTNSLGNQIGLEVSIDKLVDFEIRQKGSFDNPGLIIKYTAPDGKTKEALFRFATPSAGFMVSAEKNREAFERWINAMRAFIANRASQTEAV
jgi:hypothetical protein